MAANAFDTEITETAEALDRAVAPAAPDAAGAGLRRARLDPRRCHRAEARLQGRHHRGPDAFQPVRPARRAAVGTGLVRDRLPLRALPQRLLRRRGGAGDPVEAAARHEPVPDPDGQARRHRGAARHGLGRRTARGDRARGAPRRAQAARRSRDPARREGGADQQTADGADGVRPEHGRPLSVLAAAEARRHHRELAVLFRRRQSVGQSRSSRWRC